MSTSADEKETIDVWQFWRLGFLGFLAFLGRGTACWVRAGPLLVGFAGFFAFFAIGGPCCGTPASRGSSVWRSWGCCPSNVPDPSIILSTERLEPVSIVGFVDWHDHEDPNLGFGFENGVQGGVRSRDVQLELIPSSSSRADARNVTFDEDRSRSRRR